MIKSLFIILLICCCVIQTLYIFFLKIKIQWHQDVINNYYLRDLKRFEFEEEAQQEKCTCEIPILQENTKECAKCKLYIEKTEHTFL